MKAIKFLAIAILTSFAVEASAQLTKDLTEWTRFEVSFDAQRFKYKGEGVEADGITPKGASIAVMKGISLTNNLPIFLDLGGRLSWTHSKDSYDKGDEKCTFMNIAIPVEAAYKFAFASAPNVKIVPFFGPNFKFNFLARRKWEPTKGDDVKANLFKEENGDARIFQFGLNLGLGVNLRKFYVGYNFQPDLSSFKKDGDNKTKTINNYITVGVNF